MGKHIEESALQFLQRKESRKGKDKFDREIIIIHLKNIGNGTLGVIDFLTKYCEQIIEIKED